MRICMFSNTYLPHVGGVANSVSTFVEDLRSQGHEVLVVAPTFPEVEAGRDDEAGIYRVPAIQNFNGSDFSVRLPLPYVLADNIDRFEPEVIHSHHPFLLGDSALRFARSRKLPLIFTHHTLYENYTHYVPLDSEIMQSFAVNLATEYANLCQAVIAPSRSIADIMSERGVKRPVSVIPTGIDLPFFANGNGERCRKRYHLDRQAVVIGHVGRLAKEKNLLFLSDALSQILKNDKNARALIVGDGDAKEEMQQRFEKEQISSQVVLPGVLTGDDLADAYRAMDLFIFASKSETQGLVIAEAMAAGLPVVALDASGVREVLRDKVNGKMLAEESTADEFASVLDKLLKDVGGRKELSEEAQKTAKEFSRQNSLKKLLNLYSKVIEQNGHDGDDQELSLFESVQVVLQTEWTLLSEKISAASQSLEKSASDLKE